MFLQAVAVASAILSGPPHLVSPNEQTRAALLECATRAEELAAIVEDMDSPQYSAYLTGALVGAILLLTLQNLKVVPDP